MKPSLPLPPGWPRIASSAHYEDPSAAIDWLCEAFGFTVRIKVEEDGVVHHSELVYGEGVVMVGGGISDAKRPERSHRKSPRALGGANTQSMMMYVDDVDAHCARARARGAGIVMEPTNSDYGAEYWEDRGYEAVDLEGHHWYFCQRIRNPPA